MFAVAFVLTLVWMALGVVAGVALVRGRVRWAHIHTRKAAGGVLVAAVAVMIISGLVAPKQQTDQARVTTTSSASATAPTVTTSVAAPPTPTAVAVPPATTLAAPSTTGTAVSPLPTGPAPQAIAPALVSPSVQVPAPQPVSPAAPAPAAPQWVTPGAFCAPHGAIGTTKTGKTMVCDTTATDDRNRWRHE
ncbi:hypothetical protein [Nocardia africana]|uniref:Uncharacterized protein n=1 Tax=Nocardia africana TaxID=134964 RepID=A0ABW6NTX3_9NOCA